MKKILLFLFLIYKISCFSQDEDAWVYFKDKPNAITFLSNPLSMLTQRSLDRRVLQNIPLDIKDVPIYQPYINQITAIIGITVKAKSKWLNCLHIRGTQTIIKTLSVLPFVDHLDFANSLLNSKINTIPKQLNPINKNLTIATTFNYGTSANQIQMLNGHLLHQQNFTGQGKVIAVLDAGFPGVNTAQPFQRLFSNNLILGGYDFVNKSSNFYTGNSHGTLVLSCMGGFKDGKLVGTAPDAGYYLFITEDVASENPVEESNWVEAAEEADRLGVDIITSSLGYFDYDNPAYSHTYSDLTGNKTFVSRGVNIAFSRGIICVASAGNSGSSSEPHIGVPAEATNVLAIGAVKFDRTYATFSSIGPSFDGRIKPDVMAQGQATVLSNTAGIITTASGTSFSGPIMAGMIASFWQAVPTLTNQQVVNLVKQSADNYLTPNEQYGYGIPDFQKAINLNSSQTAIVALNNLQDFVFYQTPNSDFVSFAFPKGIEKATVYFYDILGKFLSEKRITPANNFIPVSEWNAGIYVYKIDTGARIQSGKFLKK